MDNNNPFTEIQLDFLTEMINIGGGNAALALSNLFASKVDVKVPNVCFINTLQLSSIPYDMTLDLCCVKMKISGDVVGSMYFIARETQKAFLIRLAREAFLCQYGAILDNAEDFKDSQDSLFKEIGNIYAGTCLQAISSFCNLNIYHGIAELISDKLPSILNEEVKGGRKMLMIRTEIIIMETPVDAVFLIAFSNDFIERLSIAMRDAGKIMGRKDGWKEGRMDGWMDGWMDDSHALSSEVIEHVPLCVM